MTDEPTTTDAARTPPPYPPGADEAVLVILRGMKEQLGWIEQRLGLSVVKDAYTPEEVGDRLPSKRTPWTVRQWCNRGQARAHKVHGKGRQGEWRITHEELLRLQNEGPLPEGTFDNRAAGRIPASRRAS
jgi:hypothetical protein